MNPPVEAHIWYGMHQKGKCDFYWGKIRRLQCEEYGGKAKLYMPWYQLCN